MNFTRLKPDIISLAQVDEAIEVLWLYGSQASGSAHQHSDIDLAVCFRDWQEDIFERRLRPELLALQWQKQLGLAEGELSIVDINQAPIPLAMSVVKSACVLLSKNSARQMREQQRIMSMWENDFLYHYQNFKPE